MSLLGKILAVLNILAAGAFVAVGFMDFAKRESWSYANYVHDVAVAGPPQDDKEKNLLASATTKEWYGESPVATQVEEVDRVKKQVDDLLDKVKTDPAKQTAEMARILTPFARHYSEREWLLSVQDALAAPEAEAKVRKRMHDAFAPAVAACLTRPGLKFPQAFVEACRARGGDPAPAFEETFLQLLPAKPEKTFDDALKEAQKVAAPAAGAEGAAAAKEANDRAEKFLQTLRDDPAATLRKVGDDPADTLDKVYQDTLTAVQAQLKGQLDDLYDRARNGPKSLDSTKAAARLWDYQRAAIAHYLFNMVEILHPDAADKGVTGSPDYDRFLHVVGLRAGVQEIGDQAKAAQVLGEELQAERERERGEFTTAHNKRIDQLKDQAVRLHNAGDLLDRTNALLDKQKETTQNQQTKVDAAENELVAARVKTDAALAELRKTSDSLFKMRNDGRDLLGVNLDLEKQIRDLEKKP